MRKILLVLFTTLACQTALAGWTLDNNASTFNFLSTKKNSVTEIHTFKNLKGVISDTGDANLSIELASVETKIDIRNERMLKLLFEVARFKEATAQLSIDPEQLKALETGSQTTLQSEATVELHGSSKNMTANLLVTRLNDGSLQVQTLTPIIVNALDFGFAQGIEALREIAKLSSIDTTVPVTFNLNFK